MELQDLREGKLTHSGQAAVQIAVLLKNALRDTLEIVSWLRQQFLQRSGGQFIQRHIETLSYLGQAPLSIGGEIQGKGHGPKVTPWRVLSP